MNVSIDPPDPTRCPCCGAELSSSRCHACGADLGGPAGQRLWALDNELFHLSRQRAEVVARLRFEGAGTAAAATAPPTAPGPSTVPATAPPTAPGPPTVPATAPPIVAGPPSSSPPDHRPPPPAWATGGGTSEGLPPMFDPGGPSGPSPTPGLQVSSLLLGLGVALLVVAAVIFAAVSWNRLGALGQGALLVGLTVATAAATAAAARRRLSGTAEALGVLTVLLGPLVAQAVRITVDLPAIEDRTWANWSAWTWWPAAILVIGGAALAFGRAVRVRSPQVLGVALVQVGLPIWVALAPVHPTVIAAVLAAQGTAVALGPAFVERDGTRRGIWMAGAVVVGSIGMLVALAVAIGGGPNTADHLGAVAALAAGALGAAAVARRWAMVSSWADAATAASMAAAYAAVGRAAGGVVPDVAWWSTMTVVAAAGLAGSRLLVGRRLAVRTVSWFVAAIAALPVVLTAGVAAVAMASTDQAWHRGAGARIELPATSLPSPLWAVALAGLGALALAVLADADRWRAGSVTTAMVGLASVAALVVPPLLEPALWVPVAPSLAVALALAALAWRDPVPALPASGAAGALLVAGLWASGSPSLQLIVVGFAIALGVVAVVRGVLGHEPGLAGPGAVLGVAAVLGEAALVTYQGSGDPAWAWAAVALVAAAGGALLAALSGPWWPGAAAAAERAGTGAAGAAGTSGATGVGTVRATAARWGVPVRERLNPVMSGAPLPDVGSVALAAGATALLAGHVIAVAAIEAVSPDLAVAPSTLALSVGSVALATVAATTYRRVRTWWIWAVAASAEILVLVWYRLGTASVATPEAYTLPTALALALATWWARGLPAVRGAGSRDGSAAGPAGAEGAGGANVLAGNQPGGVRGLAGVPSWQLEGPALAVALGPTALGALGVPGATRQVVGLVVGAVLLAAGAVWRRRAPVDVGSVAVAVLGLQGLLPYAAEVPRWISFGVVGAVLVLLGATFEQRRRDLRQARRHYASLT